MSETKFEVGRLYNTRDPLCGPRRVTEINPDDPIWPIRAKSVQRPEDPYTFTYSSSGAYLDGGTHDPMDLLLPAIGSAPEEATAMSPQARRSLAQYRDFWGRFASEIKGGIADPTCGGEWPNPYVTATIICAYPTREDAIVEAERVITMLDALLEGGAR